MDPKFWHERWKNGNTPFHQGQANQFLCKYFHRLAASATGTIFVPLCGKAVDLAWIRDQGHAVLGVELSPIAVREFFQEQHIDASETVAGPFTRLDGAGISLLSGDFFALESAHLDKVTGVYDRAAIVALPEQLRAQYVTRLLEVLPAGVPILLLAFEYEPREMSGPPFSVTESEVRHRFGPYRNVELLESCHVLDQESRLRTRGLTWLIEHVFLLTAR